MGAESSKAHLFQKGRSGNPGGRPKAATAVAKHILEQTEGGKELVTLVLSIARGTHETCDDEKSIRWALDWLADRCLGRPQQSIEVSTGDPAEVPDMRGKSLEELRELAGRAPRTSSPPDSGASGGDDPPASVH